MPVISPKLLLSFGGLAAALASCAPTLRDIRERQYDECIEAEKWLAKWEGMRDYTDLFNPTDRWKETQARLRQGDTEMLSGTPFQCETKPPKAESIVESAGDQHWQLQRRTEEIRCKAKVAYYEKACFKNGHLLPGNLNFSFRRFETFKPVEAAKLELASKTSDDIMIFDGWMMFKGIEWHFSVYDLNVDALSTGLPHSLSAFAPAYRNRFTCNFSESKAKDLPPELKYSCFVDEGEPVDLAVVRGVLTAYFVALDPTLLNPPHHIGMLRGLRSCEDLLRE